MVILHINVFPLYCPSLAERIEDVPLMVNSFISQNNLASGKDISGLTPEALAKLLSYAWPGNVRELKNAIEYAFILCRGSLIDVQHLPPKILAGERLTPAASNPATFTREREIMLETLRKTGGNQSEAAKIIGVSSANSSPPHRARKSLCLILS